MLVQAKECSVWAKTGEGRFEFVVVMVVAVMVEGLWRGFSGGLVVGVGCSGERRQPTFHDIHIHHYRGLLPLT